MLRQADVRWKMDGISGGTGEGVQATLGLDGDINIEVHIGRTYVVRVLTEDEALSLANWIINPIRRAKVAALDKGADNGE